MLPIVSVVDRKLMYRAVTLSIPTRLSHDQKLKALRRIDQFRQWRSLDDKRYCLVCGRIISGWQIEVAGGTNANGALRLSCPTEGCNSIPMDWALPTNEILARLETVAAGESKASTLNMAAAINCSGNTLHVEGHQHLLSRLRRLALHLKRHS